MKLFYTKIGRVFVIIFKLNKK